MKTCKITPAVDSQIKTIDSTGVEIEYTGQDSVNFIALVKPTDRVLITNFDSMRVIIVIDTNGDETIIRQLKN